jgi:hypothetical protein
MFGAERADLENDSDSEESGDEHEPELGSTQHADQERPWGAQKLRGQPTRLLPAFYVEDRDEPSLGSVGSCVAAEHISQEAWAAGGDLELDKADDEPSIGWTSNLDQTVDRSAFDELELDDSDDEPDNRDLAPAVARDVVPPRQLRRSPRRSSKRPDVGKLLPAPLRVFQAE